MKAMKEELELVQSDLFRQFAQKHTVKGDNLDVVLFYIKLKNRAMIDNGDKFKLGWFLNDVRRQARG